MGYQLGQHAGLLSIASDATTCPKCGKPAKLILRWTYCDMSLEEAAELAVEVVHCELAKSRERLIAKGGVFACLDITK
jgi:peptide subunit release factor 1 (eRF1)